MSSVTFSTSVGGDGSTVTDDDNATTGLGNGGALIRLIPMMQQVVNVASHVVSVAGGTGDDAAAAAASAVAAASSATAAAASYDSFDDRYLGAKASDPTLDNDGNALLTGALYWNSSANVMKVYNGGAWSAAYVSASSTGASIRPSLLLDFANSKTLDPRITFTRASTATYTGADGLVKTAASGEARFDFNPTTGESLGLLIEEQRTNLLTYSEQFDNAAWTKSNASVTANAATAPDGTLTADKLVENTTNNHHAIYPPVYSATNLTVTASVYIKKAERTSAVLELSNFATGSATVRFNLTNGTYSGLVNGGDFTSASVSITDVGSGWYRCSITANKGNLNSNIYFVVNTDNGTSYTYTGDGTSGIFIWGAQLEAGAFPTSYIPTTTAQTTRASDSAVMTGTNFSSWYRQNEGTVLCNFIPKASASNRTIWDLNNQSGSEYIELRYSSSSALQYDSVDNDIEQWSIAPTGYSSLNTRYLHAAAYKANDIASSVNGSSILSDSSASLASPTQLNLGVSYNSVSENLNGHIAKLAYYPKRLTNAELQSITTV